MVYNIGRKDNIRSRDDIRTRDDNRSRDEIGRRDDGYKPWFRNRSNYSNSKTSSKYLNNSNTSEDTKDYSNRHKYFQSDRNSPKTPFDTLNSNNTNKDNNTQNKDINKDNEDNEDNEKNENVEELEEESIFSKYKNERNWRYKSREISDERRLVILVRCLDSDVTEDNIESVVSEIAIKNGFSTPNNVSICSFHTNNISGELRPINTATMHSQSSVPGSGITLERVGIVKFPSTSAADRFMSSTRKRTIKINGREYYIQYDTSDNVTDESEVANTELAAAMSDVTSLLEKRKLNSDWTCPSCRFLNFARRVVCLTCGLPKPTDEEVEIQNKAIEIEAMNQAKILQSSLSDISSWLILKNLSQSDDIIKLIITLINTIQSSIDYIQRIIYITPVTVTGPTTNITGKGANSTLIECTIGKGANSMGIECTMGKDTEGTGTAGASTVTDTVTEETRNGFMFIIFNNNNIIEQYLKMKGGIRTFLIQCNNLYYRVDTVNSRERHAAEELFKKIKLQTLKNSFHTNTLISNSLNSTNLVTPINTLNPSTMVNPGTSVNTGNTVNSGNMINQMFNSNMMDMNDISNLKIKYTSINNIRNQLSISDPHEINKMYMKSWMSECILLPNGKPDIGTFQYDPNSDYFFDHQLSLYYDAASGYYMSLTGNYFIYNEQQQSLIHVIPNNKSIHFNNQSNSDGASVNGSGSEGVNGVDVGVSGMEGVSGVGVGEVNEVGSGVSKILKSAMKIAKESQNNLKQLINIQSQNQQQNTIMKNVKNNENVIKNMKNVKERFEFKNESDDECDMEVDTTNTNVKEVKSIGNGINYEKGIEINNICFICLRMFDNIENLNIHQQESKYHQALLTHNNI